MTKPTLTWRVTLKNGAPVHGAIRATTEKKAIAWAIMHFNDHQRVMASCCYMEATILRPEQCVAVSYTPES